MPKKKKYKPIKHCLNCLKPLPEDHTDPNGTPKAPICTRCEWEEAHDGRFKFEVSYGLK